MSILRRLLLLMGGDFIFPGMNLLDDFNRPDSDNLGANWTGDIFGERSESLSIISNKARPSTTQRRYSDYWNVSQIGPDFWLTVDVDDMTTVQNGGMNNLYIIFRSTSPGSLAGGSGYYVHVYSNVSSAVSTVYLKTSTDSILAETQLDYEIISPAKIGLKVVGSSCKVYIYHNDRWNKIIDLDNLSYTSTGYLGIGIYSNASFTKFDNLKIRIL